MTVLSIAADDLFVMRVTKYLSSNPSNTWQNSYEFQATAVGTEADLLELANQLVIFEAGMHKDVVVFDRALISTWEADSVPYNPETFISSTLTAVGAVGDSTTIMPLDKTLSIARVAGYGRVGHIFLRGALDEDDVSAPAGTSKLDDRAALQTRLDTALTTSGLTDYVGTTPVAGFRMVMVNAAGTQIRPIVQLRVQGVGSVPTDHAWFNRTSPTP